MKQTVLSSLIALAVLGCGAAHAQSAGSVIIKAGINNISPQVDSGDLSSPSLPGTKIDVKDATSAILTGTYMVTDNISVEAFIGLPYKHDVVGAGTIKSAGKIGTLKQVSPTLMGQYRFMPAGATFRPYVGLGVTYAYFYGEEGTNVLTSLTNPGGSATHISVDSAWGLSTQLGATFKLTDRWGVDASVIKTFIKTTSHLSTGQSIEAKLDPLSIGVALSYRF